MSGMMQTVGRKKRVLELPNGHKIELAALGLQDWAQCADEALQQYRRQQIENTTRNADLLPEGLREEMIRKAFSEAQALTVDDLPKKQTELPVFDAKTRRPKMSASGKPVIQVQTVDYAIWWISKTPQGMLYSTWLSAKRAGSEMTLDEIDELFANSGGLDKAADVVGDLTKPELGNE